MSFFSWLDNLFSADENEKIAELKEDKTALEKEVKLLKSVASEQAQDIVVLQRRVDDLLKQLSNDAPFESEEEKYWNNKYPKIDMSYSVHEQDGEYNVDVRNFFTPYDRYVPVVSGKTNDEKALKALQWVRKNIKYVSDKSQYGFSEFWAKAYQTLKRKKGDCEDGAIVLGNIMLKSGIPYWRIRLVTGSVNGGGHCYITYCRETDNEFVVLDWCYWPNDKPVKDRPLHSEEKNYSDENKNYYIWFSWNQKYCFGKAQTMNGMPKSFKAVKK